jgi:hypothetical protein
MMTYYYRLHQSKHCNQPHFGVDCFFFVDFVICLVTGNRYFLSSMVLLSPSIRLIVACTVQDQYSCLLNLVNSFQPRPHTLTFQIGMEGVQHTYLPEGVCVIFPSLIQNTVRYFQIGFGQYLLCVVMATF